MKPQCNIGVILAARMGSSRLPGKAMLPLLQMPMLKLQIMRLQQSRLCKNIILATTDQPADSVLIDLANQSGISCFIGDKSDLIKRYLDCAKHFGLDYLIRITGDCPFVDGQSLDDFIEKAFIDNAPFDLATTKGNYPVGIDFELFSYETLCRVNTLPLTKDHREHLTLYFYENLDTYKIKRIMPPSNWGQTKDHFTIDTENDYKHALKITNNLKKPFFTIDELIKTNLSCKSSIQNPA